MLTMKTRTYIIHHPFNPVLSPRPTGGFFIKCTFPDKTCAGLTKVNKPCAKDLFSIVYNTPIFPNIMPAFAIVNKTARILYIILVYKLTLLHHFLNFNFFELPLRLGRQARFLYLQLPGIVSSKIGRLYNPLLIFEFCFFT